MNKSFLFMLRRRRARTTRAVKAVKYSNETYCQNIPASLPVSIWNNGLSCCLVPATQTSGMRKAKNFTLSLQYTDLEGPLAFALVYVSEGQDPQKIQRVAWSDEETAPTSLYEPNQNVIMQGLLPVTSSSRIEFKTRLARNLNSGDAIYICFRSLIEFEKSPDLCAQLNFAICF